MKIVPGAAARAINNGVRDMATLWHGGYQGAVREELRTYQLDHCVSDLELYAHYSPGDHLTRIVGTLVVDLTKAVVKDLRPVKDWRTMFRNQEQTPGAVL